MSSSSTSGSEGAGKRVCVTGGSGYIASWLIKLLLQRGYTVKATVRDPNDPRQTMHLRELCGAVERLSLFKADLLDEGVFDSIVNDCDGVFHAASPCYFEAKDPEAEIVEPAVKGTLNVLSSCTKSPSIKRVILTSSIAAVLNNGKLRTRDVAVDETWFSDPEVCKELKLWYPLSKTLAEASAWKFAKDHGIDMVAINPAMVIGPLLQPTLNSSSSNILNLVNGAKTYMNAAYGLVDVRDVANAHILAFEVPSATGRYCLAEKVYHYSEMVEILRELYPDIQLPMKCATDEPFVQPYRLCTEKARSLGINFTPVRISLKETVESLKEKKFVNL